MKNFFEARNATVAFDTLRFGTAFVLMMKLAIEMMDLERIYGNRGLVPWAIAEMAMPTWYPSLSNLAKLYQYISAEHGLTLVAMAYALGLIAMTFEHTQRVGAFVALMLHAAFLNSSAISAYGVDAFASIALFYCMVASKKNSGVLLRVLQFHVCLVYLTAGVSKAKGIDWWTGDAMWQALMQPQFAHFNFSWLIDWPVLCQVLSIGTMLIEASYPFLIWSERTRVPMLFSVLLLHVGIAAVMGLVLFASMMVVLNLAAFGAHSELLFVNRNWRMTRRAQ